MRFSTVLVIAALSLAGCATEVMKGFVGHDVTDVIVKYGPPANAFDLPDGRRAFQWRQDSTYFSPGTTTYNGTTYGNHTTGTAVTTGAYAGVSTCYYTLYAQPGPNNRWTVVGFEQPTFECL
jgi:hypothetical protein